MFAATFAPNRPMNSLASAYRQVGLETATSGASPHKLIEMLFDGFQDAVARARGALQAKQIEAKARAISHAARIVEEGLKAGLNLADGGAI
jgi:flagellar secretion chaperone FliS